MKNKYKHLAKFIFVIFFIFTAYNITLAENNNDNLSYKSNEVLVKFKKNVSDEFLTNFSNVHNLSYEPEKNNQSNQNFFLFQFDFLDSVHAKIKELKKDKTVKSAQPNYIYQIAKKKKKKKYGSYQDPYFIRQWWLLNNGKYGEAGADLYLASVWPQENPGWPGVVVGVVDTGVNPRHTDLKKNLVSGFDFVHDNSSMEDRDGHGSFISGLIASQVGNRKGIAGLSRLDRLKIMPLKFDFSTDQAVSAIAYAQAKGVRILNMSWGTNEYDSFLHEAIQNYNGLVMAAAGNEGTEHTTEAPFYPCDFDLPNLICVGASTENDLLASYSDWGHTVDVLAPGGEILPLISFDAKTNRYAEGMGTSFSTAFVSGAAGLVLSANPGLSNLEIKDLLLQTVRKKDNLTDKVSSGGILNIKAAVNREVP